MLILQTLQVFFDCICMYISFSPYTHTHTVCESGSIRLVNGNVPYEGRVEVCSEEAWGTVCDDFWTQEDANVACLQAGYSRFGMIACFD